MRETLLDSYSFIDSYYLPALWSPAEIAVKKNFFVFNHILCRCFSSLSSLFSTYITTKNKK